MKSPTLTRLTLFACVILLLGQVIIFYAVVNPQLHCQNQKTYIKGGSYNDISEFLYDIEKSERIDNVALSTYIDPYKNEQFNVIVVTCPK